MANKTEKVIEKFISATEDNKMTWKVLEDRELPELQPLVEFYENLSWETIYSYCYQTRFNNAHIFLISFSTEDYKKEFTRFDIEALVLAIQKPGQELIPLNNLQNDQATLFRLFNMIDRQVNKVNEFLDEFLDDFL